MQVHWRLRECAWLLEKYWNSTPRALSGTCIHFSKQELVWCNGQLNAWKLYFKKRKKYLYRSDICAACVQIYRPLPERLVRAKQKAASQGSPSQLSILCSAMQLNLCTLISFIQVYLLLKLAVFHHRNRSASKMKTRILNSNGSWVYFLKSRGKKVAWNILVLHWKFMFWMQHLNLCWLNFLLLCLWSYPLNGNIYIFCPTHLYPKQNP